jgi:hypothetical protein
MVQEDEINVNTGGVVLDQCISLVTCKSSKRPSDPGIIKN